MVQRIPVFALILALVAVVAGCGPAKRVERPPDSTPDPDQLRALSELPVSPDPVLLRFAVIGDWGSGEAAQSRLAAIMCDVRRKQPFDYVVTTGDNFYSPDGRATQSNFDGPEACLNGYPGNQWRAAWGNHDYGGDGTSSALGAPDSPKYYTWTIGDVAFFVYDGTRVTFQQRQWLRDEVCGSGARLKIIYGHQPPYSTGPHGPDANVQSMVAPVARDCGVALVLSGHDHIYMRSQTIDGVTYVVTGGGGGVLYNCESRPAWLAMCASKSHFLIAEVTGSSLRIRAIGLDGGLVDSFEVPLAAPAAP